MFLALEEYHIQKQKQKYLLLFILFIAETPLLFVLFSGDQKAKDRLFQEKGKISKLFEILCLKRLSKKI